MHLMYYTNEQGERVYTLKVPASQPLPSSAALEQARFVLFNAHTVVGAQKEAPDGRPTESAHPARFSPDDKFSKQRLICKKRFGLLPMQRPSIPL